MEELGEMTLRVEEPQESWALRINEHFALRLDQLRWGASVNLLSQCCIAWVEWLPEPARLVCGECRENTWTLLDVSNPAWSHYCQPTSPLLLAWCELALDPLDAELVAAELREVIQGILAGETDE